MANAHPMLPDATHDETAEQMFVRDFKVYLGEQIEPHYRKVSAQLDPGAQSNSQVETVYEGLLAEPSFRSWASLRRTSQEMLWSAVGDSVARQSDSLAAKATIAEPLGSVTLNPDFVVPPYLADRDVHLMPGGYALDDNSVDQGAIMDQGGAVYMLGRNGGQMNDVRGHTMVSHLFARFPGVEPKRILELGCGIGASAVPVAQAFPDAEIHAVDVGASMLRYAHARSEHLGVAIHYAQDDAEHTRFEEGSFDLVFTCVLMHETSEAAMSRIIAESYRVLKPGGIAIHLEVPQRYSEMDLWGKIRGQIEMDYNNEPAWKAAISVNFDTLMQVAGFADVQIGFQDATSTPTRGAGGFSETSKGVFRSWFVASGRRP